MNYQELKDEELKDLVEKTREKLQQFETQVTQTDNSADRSAMRAEMTRFNHLKMEATRRGLDI